ncbi:MAG: S9 family peptidase [Clostridia bacterium]|nr:S9 family peptidase [Clostridia bacterium]
MRTAPYGSWVSPVTAELLTKGARRLSELLVDGEDVYWIEGRPWEEGRSVLVRAAPRGEGAPSREAEALDVTPRPFNVRTRVHEYGGGAALVHRGVAYFVNFADQRLYRVPAHGRPVEGAPAEPRPITPELPLRYADMRMDERRGRILAVREDHRRSDRDCENAIVAIALPGDGSAAAGDGLGAPDDVPGQRVLVSGHDFFSSPRISPDGRLLAWLSWDHPRMPWDGTELWVAAFAEDGGLGPAALVAGGPGESVFQPEWSEDGHLHFVSDRTGWWNHYRARVRLPGAAVAGSAAGGADGAPQVGPVEPLFPMEAEFGVPAWAFGLSTYGLRPDGSVVACYRKDGVDRLAILAPERATGGLPAAGGWALAPLALPYTAIAAVQVRGDRVWFLGSAPDRPLAVVELDLAGGRPAFRELRRELEVELGPGYVSVPEPIAFPTTGGETAHGLFYRPRNRDFAPPAGERPPLLVVSHGGPTGATSTAFNLGIQYWTSRGFAVVDVDYRGSTGYGRAYRDALKGRWGVADVDDCCAAALHLAGRGEVDAQRLAIRGGSAGGYTTLCALAFRDVFHAGASHFGVSDVEALARDTHKFESRYLDGLIGPYPERRDLYLARSPIHFADRIRCPVIFFQGLEDRVVPPDQAERMVAALRAKGVPVAYLAFPGEGHGFRRAEHIRRALEAELYFYSRVFGFEPAEALEPVAIE